MVRRGRIQERHRRADTAVKIAMTRAQAIEVARTADDEADSLLYWLLYQKLFPYFRLFRIFRYLTFRTVFASLTALLIGLLIGPFVIEKLREFQIGQYIREEGPQSHQKKVVPRRRWVAC